MKAATLLSVVVICGSVCGKKIDFCDSPVYCYGPLLDVVQKSKIFQDSKTIVDMSLIHTPNETLRNFHDFMRLSLAPNQDQIRRFVLENFIADEDGLQEWIPTDYDSDPLLVRKIRSPLIRDFARSLVHIWPTLGRRVKKQVEDNPEKYSLVYLPNGFLVPGGRFREMYYWDSYWIIKGLLLSGMKDTVRGILDNFVYLIEKYGFVPNGSRVYYLNRSQPPLLALMVGLYIDSTDNVEWLRRNVGVLEKELKWWLNNRVAMVKKDGKTYFLAHFSSEIDTPRPESYYEDVQTCEAIKDGEKGNCYVNLRSGAESGWDFSSRWLFHSNCTNLTYIQVTRVAPVDLNAYLCRAFRELSRFYNLVGDTKKSFQWLERSYSWAKSIESVFYDDQDGIWYDYDLSTSQVRRTFYLSNFAPLWCETYDLSLREKYGSRVVTYLNNLRINEFTEGVPTSLVESGEQWDMPNAFPPLQEILILGLWNTGNAKARELASTFAHRWIWANIRNYNKNKVMFEKYHALEPGEFATGGEYMVQFGFGWTNGVALSLIDKFYVNTQ